MIALATLFASSFARSAEPIDPCLVGSWVATTVTALSAQQFPHVGGEGFRVTFDADGTQSVDYADMKPFEWSKGTPDHHWAIFRGKARGRITTANRHAKVENIEQSDTTRQFWARPKYPTPVFKLGDLGPGALGVTTGENRYACDANALEYEITIHAARTPTHFVKLARVEKGTRDTAGRYPEEGP